MVGVGSFLIVDDHPLFREALRGAVESACPDAAVCEATTIADALAEIEVAQARFDLVLLDLALPGTSGFEGLVTLRNRFPNMPVIIVSSSEDQHIIQQAMHHGAAGFVPKSLRKADIAEAVATVLGGATYRPAGLSAAVRGAAPAHADLLARLATLTPQQLRVLRMLRQGLLNKQIAHELDVGETTVKAHVSEVLRKLGVYSRTQAVIEVTKVDLDSLTHMAP